VYTNILICLSSCCGYKATSYFRLPRHGKKIRWLGRDTHRLAISNMGIFVLGIISFLVASEYYLKQLSETYVYPVDIQLLVAVQ
jgi:hypothetical protein